MAARMKKFTTIELEVPASGEVFTHHNGDTGITRTFAVELMRNLMQKHGDKVHLVKLARMEIDPGHVANTLTNMGIEPDRLVRLVDPWLHQPCISILESYDDPSGVRMIDGHHRLVKLHSMGETHFDCWIFLPALWEQFLLANPTREDWRTMNSGVLEREKSNVR